MRKSLLVVVLVFGVNARAAEIDVSFRHLRCAESAPGTLRVDVDTGTGDTLLTDAASGRKLAEFDGKLTRNPTTGGIDGNSDNFYAVGSYHFRATPTDDQTAPLDWYVTASGSLPWDASTLHFGCALVPPSQTELASEKFVAAACSDDEASLQLYLGLGPVLDVNAQNSDGDTALNCAITNNHPGAVALLLNQSQHPVDVEARDSRGRTALLAAVTQRGSWPPADPGVAVAMIQQLGSLRPGLKSEAQDLGRETAFMYALDAISTTAPTTAPDWVTVLQTLLKQWPATDLAVRDASGSDLLFRFAARLGSDDSYSTVTGADMARVDQLLTQIVSTKRTYDFNAAKDSAGRTFLMALLAGVNPGSCSPTTNPVCDIVHGLLSAHPEIDISAKDTSGLTAVQIAGLNNPSATLQLVRDRPEVDLHGVGTPSGASPGPLGGVCTPLAWAAMSNDPKDIAMVAVLDRRSDIDLNGTCYSMRAIVWAREVKHDDVVAELARAGAHDPYQLVSAICAGDPMQVTALAKDPILLDWGYLTQTALDCAAGNPAAFAALEAVAKPSFAYPATPEPMARAIEDGNLPIATALWDQSDVPNVAIWQHAFNTSVIEELADKIFADPANGLLKEMRTALPKLDINQSFNPDGGAIYPVPACPLKDLGATIPKVDYPYPNLFVDALLCALKGGTADWLKPFLDPALGIDVGTYVRFIDPRTQGFVQGSALDLVRVTQALNPTDTRLEAIFQELLQAPSNNLAQSLESLACDEEFLSAALARPGVDLRNARGDLAIPGELWFLQYGTRSGRFFDKFLNCPQAYRERYLPQIVTRPDLPTDLPPQTIGFMLTAADYANACGDSGSSGISALTSYFAKFGLKATALCMDGQIDHPGGPNPSSFSISTVTLVRATDR